MHRIAPLKLVILPLILSVLLGAPAWAGCGSQGNSPCPVMRWEIPDGGQLAFRINDAGATDYSQFRFDKVGPLDLKMEVKSVSSGKAINGTVIISGDAMLVRDLPLKEGSEFEAADVPWIAWNLVLTALETAVTDGPKSVIGTRDVEVKNSTETLRVTTPQTARDFPAPWAISGTVVRKSPRTIEYSLRISYSVEELVRVLNVVGTWTESAGVAALNDSMSLKGWSAYLLPFPPPRSSTRHMAHIEPPAATLADLRDQLKTSASTPKP